VAVFPSAYPNTGQTVTVNAAYNIGTIDMSERTTNTMTLGTSTLAPFIYGNWINGTGTTLTGAGTLLFAGRGSQTITSAGKTFTQRIIINTPSGLVTLQDAITTTYSGNNAIDILQGTFDAVSYNVTISSGGLDTTSSGNIRSISVGSGLWTIASIGGGWSAGISTNLTVTGTGTIKLTSAFAKTFAGGGIDYSGITLDQGGAGTLTITGNNTFANITNTYGSTGATTIAIGTTTQRVNNFAASGELGKVLTVTGASAASPGTLIYTGSGTATASTVDYLTVTGIRAYDLTDTWYAGANSTNNGSLGWIFASSAGPVISPSTFFLMF
jgi:hypothetical protein